VLGRAFHEASESVAAQGRGFIYRAAHFDARPDWVFVVGASRNIERVELLRKMDTLMGSALTAYGKTRCFIAVDRDSVSYEVGLSHPDFRPALADHELGGAFLRPAQGHERSCCPCTILIQSSACRRITNAGISSILVRLAEILIRLADRSIDASLYVNGCVNLGLSGRKHKFPSPLPSRHCRRVIPLGFFACVQSIWTRCRIHKAGNEAGQT
jgi:hypothetical protein